MNWPMVLFAGIFLTVYALINYYIGWRGWHALKFLFSLRWAWAWAVTVGLLTLSYPAGRWIAHYVPHYLGKIIIHIGSYWMAAMYYLLLIFLLCDLLRIVNRTFNFVPLSLRGKFPWLILLVIGLVTVILIYGTWNAHHPTVSNYEVSVNKKSSSLEELHIVVVSDIHLGWIVGIDRLRQMAETVNALDPDLILFAGDIVDEGVDLAAEQEMPQVLNTLHPRYGTFAVMGNHEYISGQAETTIGFLNQNGIRVLRDQSVEIKNAFYVIGRDEASRHRFDGQKRLELTEIMENVNVGQLPIILVAHEPSNLQEVDQAGIDLQFSGHTHLGQLFPNNYITRAVYEKDWGYLRKNNLQIIVSSGYGTWGPPIRIGNRPEIVDVIVRFQ